MNAPIRITGVMRAAVLGAILAASCGTPPVVSALDKYVCDDAGVCTLPPLNGLIQGSVVYQGPRRGDVVLFLFAANALPPPDGTATTPAAIARVPSATLFAGAAPGSTGPFSAPYLFTSVAPGSYQIRGFIDLTGDFDPFADFDQSPRAGAPTGGTVTFNAEGVPSLTSFTVLSNVIANEQVVIGQEVPYDPPAFVIAPGTSTSFPQNIDRPQTLVLNVFNPNVPSANFANPKFTIQLNPNAQGQPQESDADGLIDIYPQVNLLQTSSLQSDGSSIAVSGSAAAIVPCKVLPISVWPLLIAQPASQIGLDQISVLVEPFAVQLNAQGTAIPLQQIPAGSYELVVAERTGQIWTLPNSLGSQLPTSPYYVASQATTISFTSVIPPKGAISGKVFYPAGHKPHNLIIQAFKGGPQLAPPLAAQLPARVESIPQRFITFSNSDDSVQYTLDDLTPGDYVVEAIDDADGNFNSVDILQTATSGDLQGGALDAHGNLVVITVATSTVEANITLVGAPGQDGQGNGTPLDPPAFVYDPSSPAPQMPQDARSTVRIEVLAQPDVFPALSQNPATTFFTVGLVRDGSGNAVDSDGDGLPDVWPRAFLLRIDPSDPEGLALASPTTALPAAVDPTPFLPALLAPGVDPGLVLPTFKLSIIVRPSAVDLTNPAAPARLAIIPAGKYKLILMNKTGQLWEVPNSSGSAALDPAAAALVNTASQSVAFTVVPPISAVPNGEIDGTLTLAGVDTFVSAYVFAYAANNPPPPLGTGSPVSVDFHAAAEFATSGTNKSVAFALPALPGGNYLVTAVVDARGDFAVDPQFWAAAPGPGDFVGGHVDANFQLTPIAVAATAVTAQSVIVSGAQPLPARPSFILTDDAAPITSDITTLFPDALTPQRITVTAQTILNSQTAAIDPEPGPAFFPVEFQSCAADGIHGADTDFDNLPDLYPRILVVKLLDADPTGLTTDPANIAIPAAVDPTPFLDGLGSCSTAIVVTATNLSVILQPLAVQEMSDGSLLQMPIPAGRYGIVLESKSGQVWRIPNPLEPSQLDPRSAATAEGQSLATQSVAIRVAAQVPASLGGSISGTINLTGQNPTSVGNLLVLAYNAEAPPPPLGLGRPVAVELIPRAVVEGNVAAGNFVIPYQLSNLPPSGASAYLVLAINDVTEELSPSLDFLSTPPYGAQIAFVGGKSPTPIPVASSAVANQDIDLNANTQAIPFDRPAFYLSGTLDISSSAPGAAVQISLNPIDPAGLPYTPSSMTPAFHPTLALNAQGQPYTDPSSGPCNAAGQLPYASSMVYASPIDTGQPYLAAVLVNACQFCQSLTGTPDCTGAPLAIPTPMTTPIIATVLNASVDPATKSVVATPLPPGHYAITLVEQTGQSWTVPNELAESPDPSGVQQGTPFTVLP